MTSDVSPKKRDYFEKKVRVAGLELPPHLGGHMGKNHVDAGALRYLHNTFNIKSILDIGCGLGEMKYLCDKLQISYEGVDGDNTIWRKHKQIIIQDYTKGKTSNNNTYDLAWSTEFLEHVKEEYIDNYMNDFVKCKYALVTHAPPGKPGYHHVNCQTKEYWINTFSKYDFKFDKEITETIRSKSLMEKNFIRENGLFFIKQ